MLNTLNFVTNNQILQGFIFINVKYFKKVQKL